jgi:hypothetical protein
MGVIAKTFSLLTGHWMQQCEKASSDPAGSQNRVLRNLLARAADTEWGRRYDFPNIRSPQEFRDRVPLTGYEEAATWWHRAFEGHRDVTWPGHIPYFALSSGTTAGNKLLPVTHDAIRSNHRSGSLLVAFMARRGGGGESIASGKVLYLGGSSTLRARGESLYGDASGIMARHMPWLGRIRRLPEPDIAAISNWEEKVERIVERHLTTNVLAVCACPSWAAMLFKRLLEEADRRGLPAKSVGELWPGLKFFVSYGMAFEPYRKAFEQYVARPLECIDTYSSSEGGMTAIQEEPGGPMRLIVDNGAFFEFIPADRADEDNPPRLHIGEVETGQDYAVIVSTNGGLWAYPLGDVVRFESVVPPRIVFAGRTQMYLSAFGEHVTLEMIESAVAAACEATSAVVADYTVCPRFPAPDLPVPAHRWLVEFDRPPQDEAQFMATVDESIRRENEDYDTHRTDDYGMVPPILVPVATGTFYAWMKQKGKLGGQHKVPRVASTTEMADEVLALSQSLSGA